MNINPQLKNLKFNKISSSPKSASESSSCAFLENAMVCRVLNYILWGFGIGD